MPYVNTGYERCQGLLIIKRIGGGLVDGYPKSYSIMPEFTFNSNTYHTITTQELQEMSLSNYNLRLADFKDYIESLEVIVDVDAITESGYEAYRENLTSCPLL